ncbi:UNVERIFIED_CONTAM: hypothetical protein O8I53_11575 [Campylobacter lari]
MKKNKIFSIPLIVTSSLSILNISASVRSAEQNDPISSTEALREYLNKRRYKPGTGGLSDRVYNTFYHKIDYVQQRIIRGELRNPNDIRIALKTIKDGKGLNDNTGDALNNTIDNAYY